MLNHFNVREESLPGYQLMTLQRAITQQRNVRFQIEGQNDKIVIKPLSLMYMHYDYWLTYEYKKEVSTISVRSISDINVLESHFNHVHTKTPITFEINKQIWEQFKQQFSIQSMIEEREDTLIVEVNCTDLDAFYISYQLAPLARMLGPQQLIDQFVNRLEVIKKQYTN